MDTSNLKECRLASPTRSRHVYDEFTTGYETILAGLAWTDCLVYLDDIIVFGRTLDEHNRRLEEVLTRLEQAGLNLNAKKCHLVREQSVILGHIVSR